MDLSNPDVLNQEIKIITNANLDNAMIWDEVQVQIYKISGLSLPYQETNSCWWS